MKITPYNTLQGKSILKDRGTTEGSFSQYLANALGQVNSQLNKAEGLAGDYAAGKDVELHNVIIAGEKASLALSLTIQVRNKVLEAYQEISRMQV